MHKSNIALMNIVVCIIIMANNSIHAVRAFKTQFGIVLFGK